MCNKNKSYLFFKLIVNKKQPTSQPINESTNGPTYEATNDTDSGVIFGGCQCFLLLSTILLYVYLTIILIYQQLH